MRLLFDYHRLKSCCFKYNVEGINDPYCEKCTARAIENPEHIVFRCEANIVQRQNMFKDLKSLCPPAMYRDLMIMSIDEKFAFILGGLGNTYNAEWSPIYHCIAHHIHCIYHARKSKH